MKALKTIGDRSLGIVKSVGKGLVKYRFQIFCWMLVWFAFVTSLGAEMLPVFADVNLSSATSDLQSIVKDVIKIVGLVFRVIGVILSVYSIGQLVLAFKNEDADSKSRASTQLVIGIVLISLPTILDSLNLADKITS